jgi:phospholipid-binding lipoprotein MlaA
MSVKKYIINRYLLISIFCLSSVQEGCAEIPKSNNNDPWEHWNRGAQGFNNDLNQAIVKPVTNEYSKIVPEFVNDGMSNFFSNLKDIGVTINDLLQFKIAQGGMDASRFLINSTAGVIGFVDVAKEMDLPKHNEDFGQTLGFWGVPSGNYLVMPFLGASSPREVVGLFGDALMNPLTYTFVFAGSGAVFSVFSAGAKAADVTTIDTNLNAVDESSIDRYNIIKNTYQSQRKHLVNDGNIPDDEDEAFQPADEQTSISQLETNPRQVENHYQHSFISP